MSTALRNSALAVLILALVQWGWKWDNLFSCVCMIGAGFAVAKLRRSLPWLLRKEYSANDRHSKS